MKKELIQKLRDNPKLYNKKGYINSNLKKMLDKTLSEIYNMQLNGYFRVWNCGNLVFTKESKY